MERRVERLCCSYMHPSNCASTTAAARPSRADISGSESSMSANAVAQLYEDRVMGKDRLVGSATRPLSTWMSLETGASSLLHFERYADRTRSRPWLF